MATTVPAATGVLPSLFLAHCTRAGPDELTQSSTMPCLIGVVGNGVMTPVEAAKKLVRSASCTEVDCEVRSDSVCAMIETLRCTAMPLHISTTPKNSASM